MLNDRNLDLLILSPIDYYHIKNSGLVTPLMLSINKEPFLSKFVLVVNKEKKYKSVWDLKSKKITCNNKFSQMSLTWLEYLLREFNENSANIFFKNIKLVDKGFQSLMPVFFGQADACLIDLNTFETTCEMNPNLSKKLVVIAESPGFPKSVICLRKSFESKVLRKSIFDVLGNLHNKKENAQLVKLFNIKKLIDYKDSYMKNVDLIMNKLDR